MSPESKDFENEEQEPVKDDPLPVVEIVGRPSNFEKYGSPIEHRDDAILRYFFYPTWRSQIVGLFLFFLTCVLCVVISEAIPSLVIRGYLFSIGATRYFLHLPILILIPGFLLGKVLIRVYDARFMVDSRGVEAQIGLLSLSLRQPRLRYEDIRGVEPEQSIWDRILGIGDLAIGSAMTEGVEIMMQGVSDPRAIQLLINSEIEKRLKMLTQGDNGRAYIAAVRGD